MTATSRRAALALFGGALLRDGTARAAEDQLLAIATATTGGVYYPLGEALAEQLSRRIPGLGATVEVTGGSVANCQLLGAGRVGMIFAQVDACVDALAGRDRFRGRPVPVRALAVLYSNRMQVVTTAASGARSVAELKGRRISTGAPGSATELMALRLLEAAGLDKDRDFRLRERLPPAESSVAVADGRLDAYLFVSGIPAAAITALAARPGVGMVLIDHAELLPRILATYGPIYFPEVIPANTYPGQAAPNRQISVANILAVRDDMPDVLVGRIAAALWDGRAALAAAHPEGRGFRLDTQKTAAAGVPWHPAAELFWKSKGAELA